MFRPALGEAVQVIPKDEAVADAHRACGVPDVVADDLRARRVAVNVADPLIHLGGAAGRAVNAVGLDGDVLVVAEADAPLGTGSVDLIVFHRDIARGGDIDIERDVQTLERDVAAGYLHPATRLVHPARAAGQAAGADLGQRSAGGDTGVGRAGKTGRADRGGGAGFRTRRR